LKQTRFLVPSRNQKDHLYDKRHRKFQSPAPKSNQKQGGVSFGGSPSKITLSGDSGHHKKLDR